jgi:uncharacterized protein with PQ loop repeat
MVDVLGYFFAAFFAVWGVVIIVNTKDTANTTLLKLVALAIATFMFAMSGMVLNVII